MLTRVAGLFRYLRVFESWRDVQRYRRLAHFGATDPVSVRVRGVSAPLSLRPGTTDAEVLWDTFSRQYHLAPLALPSGAVILDLGANVGFTAAHMSAVYPGSRVLAVEMDGRNAECARRLLAQLPRCELVHAAVWSNDGDVAYNADEAEWGFHVELGPGGHHMIRVPALSITTLMERHGIAHVHYMKMDIEGAEWPVLTSDVSWLARVDSIKIELHPQFNPSATYENCAKVLEGAGFHCERDPVHFNGLVAIRHGVKLALN